MKFFCIFMILAGRVTQIALADKDICRFSEISIVLDVSQSIIDSQWALAKEFTKKLVELIGVSAEGNRIGVATFADVAKEEIYCDDHTTVKSMKDAIDKIKQFGKLTNLEDGLRKGQDLLKSRGCGSRIPGPSSRVIVLMTDGEANRGEGFDALWTLANSIRNSGIQIYAVGVGGANIVHLERITGKKNTVFTANTFNDLLEGTLVSDLTSAVCTSPAPIATTTTTEYTSTPSTQTTTVTKTTTKEMTSSTTPESTTTITLEPTTTTLEPTTTAKKSTTTTTSEVTTTPEPEITTTAETTITTTSTKRPPIDTCSCELLKEEYSCLKWTKTEIIRKFEGNCYVDKLKLAIENITEQIESMNRKISLFLNCTEGLKQNILINGFDVDEIFRRYDQCLVNVRCKLHLWKEELIDRLNLMKKELTLEEEGFGGLTVSNPLAYLFDMVKGMA